MAPGEAGAVTDNREAAAAAASLPRPGQAGEGTGAAFPWCCARLGTRPGALRPSPGAERPRTARPRPARPSARGAARPQCLPSLWGAGAAALPRHPHGTCGGPFQHTLARAAALRARGSGARSYLMSGSSRQHSVDLQH